jgi:hypothetical protein
MKGSTQHNTTQHVPSLGRLFGNPGGRQACGLQTAGNQNPARWLHGASGQGDRLLTKQIRAAWRYDLNQIANARREIGQIMHVGPSRVAVRPHVRHHHNTPRRMRGDRSKAFIAVGQPMQEKSRPLSHRLVNAQPAAMRNAIRGVAENAARWFTDPERP